VLVHVREDNLETVHPGGTLIVRTSSGDLRWWTWAGYGANVTLQATLGALADQSQRADDLYLRLRGDIGLEEWRAATTGLAQRLRMPYIDEKALSGLKFNAALPRHLAISTLAARVADTCGARAALLEAQRFTTL
jgi:ATP-dependent Lhr-like helicase